jgi:hypothetical protein
LTARAKHGTRPAAKKHVARHADDALVLADINVEFHHAAICSAL